MPDEIHSFYGTDLAVDKNRYVYLLNRDEKKESEYLGKIIYNETFPVFIPASKTINGQTGQLGMTIHLMEALAAIMIEICKTPSDAEINALFHGKEND